MLQTHWQGSRDGRRTLKANTERMRALRVWSATAWPARSSASRSRRVSSMPPPRARASCRPRLSAFSLSASACEAKGRARICNVSSFQKLFPAFCKIQFTSTNAFMLC